MAEGHVEWEEQENGKKWRSKGKSRHEGEKGDHKSIIKMMKEC